MEVEAILNAEGKPKRITISGIGYAVGKRAWIEKHHDKLPLTKTFLDLNVESVEQFRIRRIKWAIHELKKEGKKTIRWEVLKKAGIRPEHVNDELWENIV